MVNRIAEHIVTRLEPIITPYFMYCEQQTLPYCVYEMANEAVINSKSGVVGYSSDATVYLAAATEDHAQQLKEQVLEALLKRDNEFIINITAMQPAFAEEQWLWKIDFNITQTDN